MVSKGKNKFRLWWFLITIISLGYSLTYLGAHWYIYKYINKNYQIIYNTTNSFGEVWVYNDDDMRCLAFEVPSIKTPRQTCIYIDNIQMPVFEYQKMVLGALYLNPRPKKILMLGLGGGALIRYLQNLVHDYVKFDIVEINPELKKISKEFFFLEENKKTEVFIEDAYQYVSRALNTKNYYDLIIMDLFSKEYIPSQFLSINFMKMLKGILSTGGVFAINTFTNSKTHSEESELIKKEFGNFYNLVGDASGNRIMIAYNGELPLLELVHYNADTFHEKFHKMRIEPKWLLSKFMPYKINVDN
ncbi:spermidine synthase [Wolbachia endosymbiont of Chironomus riparius]|uniref:spermidine synthase n=1 Tax=Wolbachia endosymbiont of Chironomus riparius TaxID=2883238 RepID=UPI0020A1E2BB|nr:fused MFS/spermidine synthase [Wolbachia endosymbiont of Chironomus riparius]